MLRQITKEEYNKFSIECGQNHFLNSYSFAELRTTIGWDYEILGYYNDDKLIFASIVLYRNLKLGKKLSYISRGFIGDYLDTKNINLFIEALKYYLKNKNVIVLKTDPDYILNYLDKELNSKEHNDSSDLVMKNLVSAGFKHQGYLDNFEGMLPRHTVRIDTSTSIDEIRKLMDKKNKRNVKIGSKKGLELKRFYSFYSNR